MSNSTPSVLRFNNSNKQFYTELKKRVDSYFKDNNISKTGNANMYIKTVFMISAYLVPYFLLVFNVFDNKLVWLAFAVIMGLAMAGMGLCIMHDANHGSFSKNTKLNKFIGYVSLGLLGGYSLNWRIQHNVLHHTFTNVHNHDEDIDPPAFMRFEPHAEKRAIHKLQFIYAWVLYGLMTLMWSTTKDFKQLKRYSEKGLLKGANTTYERELPILILSKIAYFAYMLLPYVFVKNMSFLEWVAGYLVMHYFGGLVLAMIFQPAHVVESTEFPTPNADGSLENHWAIHQLKTTMNFATNDPVFTWLVGGLNHQVEHHLFPTICHVHYPHISKIVEQTAHEFNIPYLKKKTFLGALRSHEIMLWRLGRV